MPKVIHKKQKDFI